MAASMYVCMSSSRRSRSCSTLGCSSLCSRRSASHCTRRRSSSRIRSPAIPIVVMQEATYRTPWQKRRRRTNLRWRRSTHGHSICSSRSSRCRPKLRRSLVSSSLSPLATACKSASAEASTACRELIYIRPPSVAENQTQRILRDCTGQRRIGLSASPEQLYGGAHQGSRCRAGRDRRNEAVNACVARRRVSSATKTCLCLPPFSQHPRKSSAESSPLPRSRMSQPPR
jgi:hypothetical protein